MKRIFHLALMIALIMLLSLIITSCDLFNPGDDTIMQASEGLEFTSNGDGTCYVSGIGTCTDSNIIIPEKSPESDIVTKIGSYSLSGCQNLKNVVIPISIATIDDYAFINCTNLKKIIIPNSVTSIGRSTFECCISLTSVTIPDSITSIGSYVFWSCTSLTNITVDDNNANYKSIDGNLYSKDGKTLIQYAVGKSETSFIIPDSVTNIDSNAFAYCDSLISVTIPESVISIGDSAFYSCTNITSTTIPDSVKKIGSGAFENCSSLTEVHIKNIAAWCNIDFYDYNSNPLFYAKCLYLDGNEISGNLIIPDGTTSIGTHAFHFCDKITSVTIPDSVTSIDDNAFEGCRSLESVIIPDSVTSIGSHAFADCDNLRSVKIPDSVTNIGNWAFEGCRSLESLIIPDSVTSIGDRAFKGCRSLASVTIPDSVTSIGYSAFGGCRSLTSVIIPDSVTSIGDSAFSGCSSLTSVTIPDSVTSIGDDAFRDCTSLTSVTIGKIVNNFGFDVFSGCYRLFEVIDRTPNLNITAGSKAFGGVAYYAKEVHSGDSKIINLNNYLFYSSDEANYLLGYKGNETSLTLPESYNGESYELYEYAFYDCSDLTSVVISEGVTNIGEYTFAGCRKLVEVINRSSLNIDASSGNHGGVAYYAKEVHSGDSKIVDLDDYLFYTYNGVNYLLGYIGNEISITLPETYRGENYEINQYAFYKNDNLLSAIIPDSVTSIGDSAFEFCTSLTSVTIGDGVTSTGDSAFAWCDNLTTVYIGDIATWCNILFDSSNSNPLYYAKNLYFRGKLVTDLIIPEGVESIGSYAFCDCICLTSVTIPDSVTSIGDSAFRNCTNLESVTIGKGVESIGGSAFSGCSSLTSVTIGERVESIGDSAFYNCRSLASITIPDSVTSISSDALRDCHSLTSITVSENNAHYKSIDGNLYSKNGKTLIQYAIGKKGTSFIIPDIVTNIDSHAFSGCSSLTSITIPNGVTSIGSAAFSDCTSLESVTIPNSITSIGSSAFYNCKSIEKIEIPGSIIFIGNNAFEACTNLKSITFENSDGWYIFEDYWSAMDKVHGTLIDLSDSSKNVEYVTYRYADFCWYKVN